MADVFLSYAREDRSRAADIAAALTRQGWTVWWDRRILPGHTFEREIAQQLADARCVVVLWSSGSVTSDWVRDEAAEATNRGKLVPALIEDVTPPFGFRQYHHANLAGWTGDEADVEFRLLSEGIDALAPRGAPSDEPSGETLPRSQTSPAVSDLHPGDVERAATPPIVQSKPPESQVDSLGAPTMNSANARPRTPTEPEQAVAEEHPARLVRPATGIRSRVRVTRLQMALALIALAVIVTAIYSGVLSDAQSPREPTVLKNDATVSKSEPTAPKDEPTVLKDAVANVTRGPNNRRRIALLKADQDGGLAAYTVVRARLMLGARDPLSDDISLNAVLVTPNFFAIFREQPVLYLGPGFSADVPKQTETLETVLSYALWARRFGRDPALVGESVNLNGSDHKVVGVAREGFAYPASVDVWTTAIHAETVSMPAVIRSAGR